MKSFFSQSSIVAVKISFSAILWVSVADLLVALRSTNLIDRSAMWDGPYDFDPRPHRSWQCLGFVPQARRPDLVQKELASSISRELKKAGI
jgi:hypothetical protein